MKGCFFDCVSLTLNFFKKIKVSHWYSSNPNDITCLVMEIPVLVECAACVLCPGSACERRTPSLAFRRRVDEGVNPRSRKERFRTHRCCPAVRAAAAEGRRQVPPTPKSWPGADWRHLVICSEYCACKTTASYRMHFAPASHPVSVCLLVKLWTNPPLFSWSGHRLLRGKGTFIFQYCAKPQVIELPVRPSKVIFLPS